MRAHDEFVWRTVELLDLIGNGTIEVTVSARYSLDDADQATPRSSGSFVRQVNCKCAARSQSSIAIAGASAAGGPRRRGERRDLCVRRRQFITIAPSASPPIRARPGKPRPKRHPSAALMRRGRPTGNPALTILEGCPTHIASRRIPPPDRYLVDRIRRIRQAGL